MPRDSAQNDNDDTEWQRQLTKELLLPSSQQYGNPDAGKMSNKRSMLATGGIAVAAVSVTLIVGLQFPFLFPKSAPYMATPGPKIRHALQFLLKNKKRASSSSSSPAAPPVFVDLGSGDGQAVYEAARLGYRAIGIEFNWTLWALSQIRRQFCWTFQERKLSSFCRRDFHSYNLQHADTVMIFAIPKTMPILGSKIQMDCRPGTDILAYRFGIPLAMDHHEAFEAKAITPNNNNKDEEVRLNADLIYERGDMRIYRMKGEKEKS